MSAETCPGCDGTKSRNARLCTTCRRRAGALGERALLDRNVRTIPTRPRTPQQNTAYHAKLGDLAKLKGITTLEAKREALELATVMFRRDVTSSTQLTELEMEQLLDRLDEQLEAALATRA